MALATLGMFVFELKTIPFQSMQNKETWRHPSVERVNAPPSYQFVGKGEETTDLACVLYPSISGGITSIRLLKEMAAEGGAYPLISGTGEMHGNFVITAIDTTRTETFRDGAPRKIEFSMSLTRVDDSNPSLLGYIIGLVSKYF